MASRILRNCLKSNANVGFLSRGNIFGQKAAFPLRLSLSASNKPTINQIEPNFEQLRKEIQTNGFISHKSFERIFATPNEITEENSLFLINCCAYFLPIVQPEEKIELFHKTWQQLNKTMKLSRDHYLSIIKVFRANKFPLLECRQLLKDAEFKTDQEVYEGLIGLACELGKIQDATDILAEMKSKEFPITENVFNSLILGYSRCENLTSCETVLETMNAANIEPSNKTYTELVKAYIENQNPDKAIHVLQQQNGSLETSQLVEIIKSAALKKYDEVIKQAVRLLPVEMTNQMEVPDAIRTVCTELVYCGQPDEALLIVKCFPRSAFNENQDIDKFGTSLISDYIRTSQASAKTIEMCRELIELGKNSRALHIASEIALRRNPEHGHEFLKALSEIEPLRPHYFWPLILHSFNKRGEIGLLTTLKDMSSFKVECDYETMSSYVLPRLAITTRNTKRAITALEDCGLKAAQILTPLISHLLFQQKFDDITWLIKTYQSKIDTEVLVRPLAQAAATLRTTKSAENFAKMIALLQTKTQKSEYDLPGAVLLDLIGRDQRNVDPKNVVSLVSDLKAAGLKISSEAADGINAFLEKTENGGSKLSGMVNRELNLPNSEKVAIHPRDMSLEDLECHLIELENKGMNARGVLRRILQLSVRQGQLERAAEINKKCIELKVQRSPGMVATVFDLHTKLENVRDAETAYREIKKSFPGFLLDEHKIIDFATLLVRSGRHDDAKKILQQRAASGTIKGGEYVSKNIWLLLTAVAQHSAMTNPTDERNYAREMLDYLYKLGYCTYSNAQLGTIIREFLLKNQVIKAVAEFKSIAETYRKTPLQLELMSELVRLSSSVGDEYRTLLQDVVTEASKIHGSLNTNINLILALAESGTVNQIRKLLIDPHFKFNQEYLIRNCEHLSGSGKITILLKLAKASRGLGHNIKEQDLYNILLSGFIRENNYTAAIELFEKLEMDDDFKISQVFIRNLVDLLKQNNFDIPSNVALRAQMIL